MAGTIKKYPTPKQVMDMNKGNKISKPPAKRPLGGTMTSPDYTQWMKNIQQGTPERNLSNTPPSYKKGGKVKKTGLALVHKGERVLTARQEKSRNKKVISKSKKNRLGKSKGVMQLQQMR